MGSQLNSNDNNAFVAIPGFSKYGVNKWGSVKSFKSNLILSQAKTAKGYLSVNLSDETGDFKAQLVHRLVAATFRQISLDGDWVVNHKDQNRKNNSYLNLEVTTRELNCRLPKRKATKGVYSFPNGNKPYRAVIKREGKVWTIGYFTTYSAAKAAYDAQHLVIYGIAVNSPEYSVVNLKKAA